MPNHLPRPQCPGIIMTAWVGSGGQRGQRRYALSSTASVTRNYNGHWPLWPLLGEGKHRGYVPSSTASVPWNYNGHRPLCWPLSPLLGDREAQEDMFLLLWPQCPEIIKDIDAALGGWEGWALTLALPCWLVSPYWEYLTWPQRTWGLISAISTQGQLYESWEAFTSSHKHVYEPPQALGRLLWVSWLLGKGGVFCWSHALVMSCDPLVILLTSNKWVNTMVLLGNILLILWASEWPANVCICGCVSDSGLNPGVGKMFTAHLVFRMLRLLVNYSSKHLGAWCIYVYVALV